jgi:hypothetical protein
MSNGNTSRKSLSKEVIPRIQSFSFPQSQIKRSEWYNMKRLNVHLNSCTNAPSAVIAYCVEKRREEKSPQEEMSHVTTLIGESSEKV